MADYNIRELQLRILNTLQTVDDVCRHHNLRYYICAGTMIGAIRHKGFIPWDDDIDIAMPRPDYERLIANHRDWLPQPLEMICAEDDVTYPLPFAKIQDSSTTLIERMHLKYVGGIYIDVFPVDGVPDNKIVRKWHFVRYEYYKRALYLLYRDPYKRGKGPSSWLPLLCRKIYTLTEVQNKIRRILTRYDYDKCNNVADYDDGSKGVIQKSILGTPTPYTFENIEVMGVEHFHAYLSNKYGDYMTIPKQSEQRQHNFHYMDLNSPYRDYKEQ